MPTAMPGIPFLAITGRIVVSTRFLMVFCGSSAAWLTEVVTPMAKQTITARLMRLRFIARHTPIFLRGLWACSSSITGGNGLNPVSFGHGGKAYIKTTNKSRTEPRAELETAAGPLVAGRR